MSTPARSLRGLLLVLLVLAGSAALTPFHAPISRSPGYRSFRSPPVVVENTYTTCLVDSDPLSNALSAAPVRASSPPRPPSLLRVRCSLVVPPSLASDPSSSSISDSSITAATTLIPLSNTYVDTASQLTLVPLSLLLSDPLYAPLLNRLDRTYGQGRAVGVGAASIIGRIRGVGLRLDGSASSGGRVVGAARRLSAFGAAAETKAAQRSVTAWCDVAVLDDMTQGEKSGEGYGNTCVSLPATKSRSSNNPNNRGIELLVGLDVLNSLNASINLRERTMTVDGGTTNGGVCTVELLSDAPSRAEPKSAISPRAPSNPSVSIPSAAVSSSHSLLLQEACQKPQALAPRKAPRQLASLVAIGDIHSLPANRFGCGADEVCKTQPMQTSAFPLLSAQSQSSHGGLWGIASTSSTSAAAASPSSEESSEDFFALPAAFSSRRVSSRRLASETPRSFMEDESVSVVIPAVDEDVEKDLDLIDDKTVENIALGESVENGMSASADGQQLMDQVHQREQCEEEEEEVSQYDEFETCSLPAVIGSAFRGPARSQKTEEWDKNEAYLVAREAEDKKHEDEMRRKTERVERTVARKRGPGTQHFVVKKVGREEVERSVDLSGY